jgi:hypothetical protein
VVADSMGRCATNCYAFHLSPHYCRGMLLKACQDRLAHGDAKFAHCLHDAPGDRARGVISESSEEGGIYEVRLDVTA